MEGLIRAMMDMIASKVCGKAIDKSKYEFTDDYLVRLYKLSKAHDLAHLVGDALIKNDLIGNDEIKAKYQKQVMIAIYRYEKINYELNRLRSALNEAQIPFIPLKGSVLRQYYPEPWMRTSSYWCMRAILNVILQHLSINWHISRNQKVLMILVCFRMLAPGTHSHFESGKFSQFWPEPGTNPAQWVRLKTPFRVHPKQPN